MFFPRRTFAAALFALLALPLGAAAQSTTPAKLTVGTWAGTVLSPGNPERTPLTYQVEYKEDVLAITMVVPEEGEFPLSDIEVTDTKISFSFTAGPKVACVLDWTEKGYLGTCTDPNGRSGAMTMVPPAQPPKS